MLTNFSCWNVAVCGRAARAGRHRAVPSTPAAAERAAYEEKRAAHDKHDARGGFGHGLDQYQFLIEWFFWGDCAAKSWRAAAKAFIDRPMVARRAGANPTRARANCSEPGRLAIDFGPRAVVCRDHPLRVLPFFGCASSELQRLQRNRCELSLPPHLLQRRSRNFFANLVCGRSPISRSFLSIEIEQICC